MKKSLLMLEVLAGILFLYSCGGMKNGFTREEYRDVLKERIGNRNYQLIVSQEFRGISSDEFFGGYGFPLHVKGDTLYSDVVLEAKLAREQAHVAFKGKILNYEQKELPRGQIEVAFSIEILDSARNEFTAERKVEFPKSYRIVFGPWDAVNVYIDGRQYQGKWKKQTEM